MVSAIANRLVAPGVRTTFAILQPLGFAKSTSPLWRTRTFAEQNDSITMPRPFCEDNRGRTMIDRKALQIELHQARLARLDAQAAGTEVEELIWQVAHFEPGKQRLVFMIDCGEAEP